MGTSRNNTVQLYCLKRAIKYKLYFVKDFSVPIKREVVSLCYTTWETQFSSFDQNFFQSATSVNQLGFFLVS